MTLIEFDLALMNYVVMLIDLYIFRNRYYWIPSTNFKCSSFSLRKKNFFCKTAITNYKRITISRSSVPSYVLPLTPQCLKGSRKSLMETIIFVKSFFRFCLVPTLKPLSPTSYPSLYIFTSQGVPRRELPWNCLASTNHKREPVSTSPYYQPNPATLDFSFLSPRLKFLERAA